MPVFVVCPDYPVPKTKKANISVYNANDGLHMNAIGLAPPPPPSYFPAHIRQHPFFGKLSRLRDRLDVHFEKFAHEYRTDKLYRIDVTPIRHGTMADYALKAFNNGKVSYDDIRIF